MNQSQVKVTRILKASLFAVLILVFAIETNAQNKLERIKVVGNEFFNESGEVVVFRGYNTSDPHKLMNQGRWNKRYFEEIKAWGGNIVRFPVHPANWRKRGREEYIKLLDQGIKWAEELGMYTIIDWHSIGNLKTSLFLHDMYYTDIQETYNFWKIIAEKYGNNTSVAFYEIFNEPTIYNQKFGRLEWSEWKSIMEEMIIVIRANGGEGIPLVAGFNWAYDLTPVKYEPVAAEGIAYVSHPYPQKREKPWEPKWTNDWGFVKDNYPVILTEMGFSGADDVGAHVPVIGDETYGEAITQYCDDKNISYVVWVFDMDWAPRLYTDKKFTPSRHGKYFKKKLNSYQK